MKFPALLALALLIALSAAPCPAAGDPAAPAWKWQVDDLVALDRVDAWLLSPDGQWLAWTVAQWDLKEQTRSHALHVTRLADNKDTVLTQGDGRITGLRWLPGRNALSFKTDRKFKEVKADNVWVMSVEGGDARPVTELEYGVDDYDWLDGETLVYSAREAESLYEAEFKQKKDTAEVVEDEAHQPVVRLFRYSLKEKKSVRLSDNAKPVGMMEISPDRRWLLYRLNMSLLYEQDQLVRPRYYLLNLQTLAAREVFAGAGYRPTGEFHWAADSSGLYAVLFHNSHPRYAMAGIAKIGWYDLAGGREREVDLNWERGAGELTVTRDGFISALPLGARTRYARYVRAADGWKQEWLDYSLPANLQSLQLARDGKTAVCASSSASSPVRYYLAELQEAKLVRKAEVMDIASPLAARPLARSEVVTWSGSLGEEIEGILYYPFNYDPQKRYPLVLMIHGGPFGADQDFFEDNWSGPAHLFCERGAFVLKPNYHGSAGYGRAFAESIAGHYYEYEVPDIEAGVDQLIFSGKVDGQRLGVIGWSNGAILGTALIVNSGRFRAASLGAGDVNWTSDYGICQFGVSFDNYYFGGPPWQLAQRYVDLSPLFKMEKVTTPTLIFHGTVDRQVPYGQSWEFYRALQQIGKAPVRFISFPGEAHGLRKLAFQRRKLEEEIAWFDRHLFQTARERNPALKKGSPLEQLAQVLAFPRAGSAWGIDKAGALLPETVAHAGLQIGRFEVTRAQWACFDKSFVVGGGLENVPVTGVSFEQAQRYTAWLSQLTGETYRLPSAAEAKTLYAKASGNTLDAWAGYKVNPDDGRLLRAEIARLGDKPVLLKPAGSTPPEGDELVYDLGGNAAEWVTGGTAMGGSADRPEDDAGSPPPAPAYTGLRVVREKPAAAAK